MIIKHFSYNFKIALEAIVQNKLRAILTSLGIICGVAAVITMLAIGKGAEQEILEKMKLLGTNNIIIKVIEKKDKDKTEEKEEESEKKKEKEKLSPGLSLKDAESIAEILPNVQYISPEIVMEVLALRESLKKTIKLVGVRNDYFSINNYKIKDGALFNEWNTRNSNQVCIIGSAIKIKLFANSNPLGKYLKCGKHWLKVVGVLEERSISKENIKNLGIRDYNYDVYIPITTMLIRYTNRSLVTKQVQQERNNGDDDDKNKNTHQLDRIVVGLENSKYIMQASEVISRMLKRRHNEVIDFEIIVPDLLLEQEQRTKRIFNIVLGAIASISLIVGGIGIMNIMLASVLERTKEIGIRRAVGAKQKDILLQFLSEAVAISLTGGFIGIVLGFVLSFGIEKITGIHTVVSPFSVFISFIVSISVGLIFGIAPAKKASQEDTIELLRYE